MVSTSPSKPWSETQGGRLSVVVGVIGLFMLVFWLAVKSRRMLPETAALVVDEQYLSFGEVWEDPEFGWTLPIRNTTNEAIEIVGFAADCHCGKVEPPSMKVPAGQTRRVCLTLDLTANTPMWAKSGSAAPEVAGTVRDFAVRISPKMQGSHGSILFPTVVWKVKGRVHPVLTVQPRAVSFGDSLVRGQPFAARSVSVAAHAPLKCLDAICQPDLACLRLERIGDGSQYKLTIQPRETLPLGILGFRVILKPQTADGPLPSFTIPAEGSVVADVYASPAIVQFGACRLGQSVLETIVLRSWSNTPFEVDRIERDAADSVVEAVKAEPAWKEFRVIQRVTHQGDKSGTIRFYVRPKETEPFVIRVPVNYLGIAE